MADTTTSSLVIKLEKIIKELKRLKKENENTQTKQKGSLMDSQRFRGNKILVIEGTGSIADNGFSTSATANEFVYDNTEHFYTNAKAVISCSFALAPTDQTPVNLYITELDVDGNGNDVTAPSATEIRGARWVGSFKMYNVTTQQYQTDTISLFGIKRATFSIENQCDQAMDADFTVTIEGLSLTDI